MTENNIEVEELLHLFTPNIEKYHEWLTAFEGEHDDLKNRLLGLLDNLIRMHEYVYHTKIKVGTEIDTTVIGFMCDYFKENMSKNEGIHGADFIIAVQHLIEVFNKGELNRDKMRELCEMVWGTDFRYLTNAKVNAKENFDTEEIDAVIYKLCQIKLGEKTEFTANEAFLFNKLFKGAIN